MEMIVAFASFFALVAVWVIAPDSQNKPHAAAKLVPPVYQAKAKAA